MGAVLGWIALEVRMAFGITLPWWEGIPVDG
jgi:hypothetical protein